MQRLLAEVIKIRKLKPKQDDNFLVSPVRCKVIIRGSAFKGFKLPPHVKMKRGWIKRMCVSPWEIREKDFIVLTPEETKLFIPKIKGDRNADGFKEGILENEFLKILVLPHYGVKISSLIYKANKEDKFKPALKYFKDEHVDMGGADNLIDEEFPGSLLNADFKVKSKGLYEYEKNKLKIIKRMKLLDGLPILHIGIEIKSKKEKEINFWQRLSFKIANNWWENVVSVPTNEGLKQTWHSKTAYIKISGEHYGLNLGAFLFASPLRKNKKENNTGNLLWAANPALLDFLTVANERTAMRIMPRFFPYKLKKNESVKYNLLWAVGESSEISSNLIAIGSRAVLPNNKILFSIIAKSKKRINRAKIYVNEKEENISLKPLTIKGVGNFLTGKIVISASPDVPIKFKLL
ncbi:MAG: hypothetical protein PHX21_08755 [bacterium]|nr:hypothetical protein [bacterium]